MTEAPIPTGRHERREGRDFVVLEREFTAPVEDVWAAVTEPERLARWIGTWTGDPSTGSVDFTMTFEGETSPTPYLIRRCGAPTLLAVDVDTDYGHWELTLELRAHAGGTTLRFLQLLEGLDDLGSVGPGWDYYLDRLVAAETGGDVAAIDFERDYHPAMEEHYKKIKG